MIRNNPENTSGHITIDCLNAFDREYKAVDASFWKIIDGARLPGNAKVRPYAYCSPSEVSAAIVKNPKISHYLFSRALERERIARTPDALIQAGCMKFMEDVTLDICMMSAFRGCKYIIRIHPAIETDLATCEIPAAIPSSIYMNLPSWSFFLEFGDDFKHDSVLADYDGVFVTILDSDIHLGKIYMKAISGRGKEPIVVIQGISENQDIEAELKKNDINGQGGAELPDEEFEKSVALVRYVTNACMYLTSKDPEYGGEGRPLYPKREKSFYGMICKEAPLPQVFTLGTRIGSAINAAKADPDLSATSDSSPARSPVTPHIRKSHWHHYWVGSRSPGMRPSENVRRLIVKWMPPIPVMVADSADLAAVVRSYEPD